VEILLVRDGDGVAHEIPAVREMPTILVALRHSRTAGKGGPGERALAFAGMKRVRSTAFASPNAPDASVLLRLEFLDLFVAQRLEEGGRILVLAGLLVVGQEVEYGLALRIADAGVGLVH